MDLKARSRDSDCTVVKRAARISSRPRPPDGFAARVAVWLGR